MRAAEEVLMSDGDTLDDVMDHYHRAADEFSRGDPEPIKALYSHRDDVALANPFGPTVQGWDQVAARLNYAASRFSDGEVTRFERVTAFVTEDLACIVENEAWRARVGDRGAVAPFDLRVTSTFRREDGMWKLVHRHADPITDAHPDGPLRSG
jgi:ketosteroid isomerase-like protein